MSKLVKMDFLHFLLKYKKYLLLYWHCLTNKIRTEAVFLFHISDTKKFRTGVLPKSYFFIAKINIT